MEELYDILFAGGIVDGFDVNDVRANIAKLFKANDATLEKLFSGKAQMIKRGVDKPAAIKYKGAMQKAGAVAVIRKHQSAAASPPPPAKAAEPAAEKPPQTMAERLAALTGDAEPSASEPAPAPVASQQAHDSAEVAPNAGSADAITLAPAGSDVLKEDERRVFEDLDIDLSAIHLAPEFAEPQVEEKIAPPAPDVSHMSMGEVGEAIPHLESDATPVNPDTTHLSMGEVGEEIPQLESTEQAVEVDTSALDLAPEGSDVLEEKYRHAEDAQAPNTDHLSLEN